MPDSKETGLKKKRILVLGSGFSGTYSVQYLVDSLKKGQDADITLISEENYFLFSPMLHEVAMGGVVSRNIAVPIRTFDWSSRCNFIQARVSKIDLDQKLVTTTIGTHEYDYLILALGGVANEKGLNSSHPNTFELKTLSDARKIRNQIIEMFEQASVEKDLEKRKRLLTFVVSGAGYTGVQTVTEMRDFVHRDLLKVYKSVRREEIRIVLVEASPKIIAEMNLRLGAYVMKYLTRRGIEVRLKSRITEQQKNHVVINDKTAVETRTTIWVTGVVANPLIAELGARTDKIGRVFVDTNLEMPGFPGVYAVGDCAHFENRKDGKVAPPRAHMAVRQARVAAHNILADIRGGSKREYYFSEAPEIVTLGAASAVFHFRRLRLYGFIARLMWMVAYAALMTGGPHKRTRIVMDWLLLLFFGRDTTLLKDIRQNVIE